MLSNATLLNNRLRGNSPFLQKCPQVCSVTENGTTRSRLLWGISRLSTFPFQIRSRRQPNKKNHHLALEPKVSLRTHLVQHLSSHSKSSLMRQLPLAACITVDSRITLNLQ